MNDCIICQIINGHLKSFIIYEDSQFISFLDSKPLFFGHSLLSPKIHCHTIYDLPITHGSQMVIATQKIGNAIMQAMQAQGTFIAINNIISQSIDHLHIHLVPRNKGDKLKGFFWPRKKYHSEAQMFNIQQLIKEKIK